MIYQNFIIIQNFLIKFNLMPGHHHHVRSKKAKSVKLSKEELKSLKKEFDSIDTDHNGELDRKELERFMEKNNFEIEFVNIAIKLFDEDGNGRISFDEFVKFTQALSKLDKDPFLLQRMLFATLDQDNSGYLDEKEIYQFFKNFSSEKVTEEDVKNIMENLDTNEDGKLSFDEIMKAFQTDDTNTKE